MLECLNVFREARPPKAALASDSRRDIELGVRDKKICNDFYVDPS